MSVSYIHRHASIWLYRQGATGWAIFLGPTLLAIGYTVVRDWAVAEPIAVTATPGLEQG